VASFASVPETITDPVQMMPIYTRLFNGLGWAGVVCTVIALAVLPLIRGLDKAHAAGITYANLPEAGKGMPTAASER
jgi:POT family proton-dependent oligopeptide transporter